MCQGQASLGVRGGRGKVKHYLLVSFQLLNEGPLMEEPLQPVLGVVVAQLLKGGPAGRPTLLRVLEAWGVHNHHRAEGVLAGLESPAQGEPGQSLPARRPGGQAAHPALSLIPIPAQEPRTCGEDSAGGGWLCLSDPTGKRHQPYLCQARKPRVPGTHLFAREMRSVKSSL